MGSCSAKKIKEKPILSKKLSETMRPMSPNSPIRRKIEGERVVFEDKVLELKVKEEPITKSYSLLPKESIQTKIFKSVFVQHNLTGNIRRSHMVDMRNHLGMKFIRGVEDHYFDHPNIVKVYEIIREVPTYHCITENCSGLKLGQFLQQNQFIQEEIICKIMTQIMLAVQYLHQQDIVHGRICIDSFEFLNDSQNYIKLVDLENCFVRDDPTINQAAGFALEIIPPSVIKPTKESDIWSLGVLFYQLLCGYLPYDGQTVDQIYRKIQRGGLNDEGTEFDRRSSASKQLLKCMLEPQIKKRIPIAQCLYNSWVQSNLQINLNEIDGAFGQFQKFKKMNALQTAVFTYMIKQFAEDQMNIFHDLFCQIDENKDGKLSKKEISQAYYKIYPDEKDEKKLDKLFDSIDSDKSGTIDLYEFVAAVIDRSQIVNLKNIKLTFSLIDQNKNGKISSREFSQGADINQKQAKDIMINFLRKLRDKLSKIKETQLSARELREMKRPKLIDEPVDKKKVKEKSIVKKESHCFTFEEFKIFMFQIL